tara:strand:- start:436 stop:834 length:399 start_codon:yes stop_codon:yes gene_type:complete
MAFKVGSTSVISGSRVLENVTGLKTVNSTSILGSGDIPASQYDYIGSIKNTAAPGTGFGSSLSVVTGDLLIINVDYAAGSAFGEILVDSTSQASYSAPQKIRMTATATGTLTATQTGATSSDLRVYVDVYRE